MKANVRLALSHSDAQPFARNVLFSSLNCNNLMSLDGNDNGSDFVIATLQQLNGGAGDRTVWGDDDKETVSGVMMTKKVSGAMMTKKQSLG